MMALRCILIVVLLVPWSTTTTASENSLVIDEFDGLNIITSHPGTVQTEAVGSQLAVSIDCSEPRQVFIRIPVQYRVQDQKMRITLGGSADVSYIGKLETLENGQEIPRTLEHTYLDYHKGPVYFSLDNKRYSHLTLYFHCAFQNPDIKAVAYIDKIEIVPLEFHDDRDFAYILAAALLLLLLLPGFLSCCVLLEEGNKGKFLAWLTPLSLLFFLSLYPVLLLHQMWSSTAGRWVAPGSVHRIEPGFDRPARRRKKILGTGGKPSLDKV